MDAKKVLENTIELLRSYDSLLGNTVAEKIIEHPQDWTKSNIGVYSVYANMILSAKEEIAKKAHGSSLVSALKKVFKDTYRDDLKGLYLVDGHAHVTNGFLGIILNEDIPELPHVQRGFNLTEVMDGRKEAAVDFPVPSFGDLKQFIAEHKGEKTPYIVHCEGFDIGFNPKYMEIMLSALPGAKVKCSSSIKPIYFEAENGTGVLLPVRI